MLYNVFIRLFIILYMPCGRKRKIQKMRTHKLKKRRKRMRRLRHKK